MMKKEIYRDYTTEAFRLYALHNGETNENMSEACVRDIAAVKQTLEWFRTHEKIYIEGAIKSVYFDCPSEPLRSGDITGRVLRYSIQISAEERTVYRWLKEARLLCAQFRGLRIQ